MRLITRPWKISTMLYLLLFVMVVVPVTSINIMILQVYKHDLLGQTSDRTQQTLHALTFSAEQEIKKMVYISAMIGVDKEILNYGTLLSKTNNTKQNDINFIDKALSRYNSSTNNYILSISFFFKNGGSYSYSRNRIEDEAVTRQTDWYKKALLQQEQVQFLGMQKNVLYDKGDPNVITTTFAPKTIPGLQNVEIIEYVFSRGVFENILHQNPYQSGDFMIINELGQSVALSSGLKNIEKVNHELFEKITLGKDGNIIITLNNEKMLINFAAVANTGWKVIHQIPYSQLTETYDKIYNFVIIMTMVGSFIFLIISFYFVRSLTKPIHILVRKMTRVVEGNLNAKIEAAGSSEMMVLGHTFNHMLDHIKQLILQNENEERAKRKAEFDALQSQINPHFLINTLNAIKLMALIHKMDNIRNMTVALMRLVSSSFNRGGILNRVSEEIENLKHYLYIMENRFGKKIDVVWQIDDNVLSHYLLKLILQPIIENCIVHGLNGKETDGTIVVMVANRDNFLWIEVADNGLGMPEEQVNQFNTAKHEHAFSGIGIWNVHHRIQLHYGQQFGLTIESIENIGTIITIRIPIITANSEDETRGLHHTD